MKLDVWFAHKILGRLDQISEKLSIIFEKELQMSAEMDALQVSVENTKTVEDSAIALIEGVAAQIKTLSDELAAEGVDNTKIAALSAELDAKSAALAAAVTANTPAA